MNKLECSGCGACCRTFPIFVSQADAEREPRIKTEAYELPDHLKSEDWDFKLFHLPFHERCVFNDEKYRCVIHPTRPSVCRDFDPGGKQCIEARGRQGLPPLEPPQD